MSDQRETPEGTQREQDEPGREKPEIIAAVVGLLVAGALIFGVVTLAGGSSPKTPEAATTSGSTGALLQAQEAKLEATVSRDQAALAYAQALASAVAGHPRLTPQTRAQIAAVQAQLDKDQQALAAIRALALASTNVATTAAPTTSMAPQPIAPLTVVFNGPVVTLQGSVPSEALKQRLDVLAKSFAAVPNPTVADTMTINPAVPLTAGVYVFDAQSEKFASGSFDITPGHAAGFDRVVAALKALPRVTVTVIGHADQTGNAADNYTLSQRRALAAVNYIIFNGISPDRVAVQAVGATDPLTTSSDPAALALNRRTSFIFYGLLL